MNFPQPRRSLFLVLALTLLLLPSCESVPPELHQAQLYQRDAIEAARVGREKVIKAYNKELLASYTKQLDLVMQIEMTKAASGGMISVESVQQLEKLREEQRVKFTTELEIKLDEFLHDDNIEIMAKLNATTLQWTQLYVEEFAGRVNQLINDGKSIYQQVTK